MRNLALAAFTLICLAMPARADEALPPCVTAAIPRAQLVGQGRMTYMTMTIYEARLYAPDRTVADMRPLALSLTYFRHLNGQRIADRTIREMRNLGLNDDEKLAQWHDLMARIFPNVEDGTTLTGVFTRNGATLFYRDGQKIGQIDDPDFGTHFFAIWLSPKASDPSLRAQLLHQTG